MVRGKRWKVASHGLDPLRDLVAAHEAQGAQHSIYISLGPVTENARRFAQTQGIQLLSEVDPKRLLSDKKWR